VFWVPDGSAEEEVIVSAAGATASDRVTDLVWAGVPASPTVAVRLTVPAAVGVPEIIPSDGTRLRPAGRLPEEIDHVYGAAPPLACRTVA
jgi:hypothetical protein